MKTGEFLIYLVENVSGCIRLSLLKKWLKMRTILSQLQSLPIFRLSLGSKELFHSNFLEFLWDIDKNNRVLFIKIINKLLPDAQKLKEDSDYSNHE